MLVSKQELVDLTGRKRPSKVAEQLSVMGIRYVRGADNWPRVHMAELDRVLVGGYQRNHEVQPDANALRAWQQH